MLFYIQRTPTSFNSLLHYDPEIYKRAGVFFYFLVFFLVCHSFSAIAFLLSPEPFSTLVSILTIILGIIALRSCIRFTLVVYSVSSLVLCVFMMVRFSYRIERPNFGYATDRQASALAALFNDLTAHQNATVFPFIIMDTVYPPTGDGQPKKTDSTTKGSDEMATNEQDMAYTYYSIILKVSKDSRLRGNSGIRGPWDLDVTPKNSPQDDQQITKSASEKTENETDDKKTTENENEMKVFRIVVPWETLYKLIQSSPSSWRITLEKFCLCIASICSLGAAISSFLLQLHLKTLLEPPVQQGTGNSTSPDPDITSGFPHGEGDAVMILGYPNSRMSQVSLQQPNVSPNASSLYPQATTSTNQHVRGNFVPFSGEGVSLLNLQMPRPHPSQT